MLAASNKTGTWVLFVLFVLCTYFGYAYLPLYSDNAEIKQIARAWANNVRFDHGVEKANRDFYNQVRAVGVNFTEDTCQMNKEEGGATVTCAYARVVEFPFLEKRSQLKFRWSVKTKYR